MHTTTAEDGLEGLASELEGRFLPSAANAHGAIGVVHAVSARDVQRAVRLASRQGFEIVVRGSGLTGERPPGVKPQLIVDTSALRTLELRPDRTARIGAGVRWRELLDLTEPRGLVASAGSSREVTVAGYVGGGGLGPLGRVLGFASDAVSAIEVVTGDGDLLRATSTEFPGLFWGLRGGKGTLGVVTAVEMRLIPVPPVLAGVMTFDPSDAGLVHDWLDWQSALAAEASTSVVLRTPGRGRPAVRFAWFGEELPGRLALEPLLEKRDPITDTVRVRRLKHIADALSEGGPSPTTTGATVLLDHLNRGTLDALLDLLSGRPDGWAEVRPLGAALASSRAAPAAISHRDAPAQLHVHDPGDDLLASIEPWHSGRSLPNSAPWRDPATVARHFGAADLARLGALSATYDPSGVLADGNLVRAACAAVPSRSALAV